MRDVTYDSGSACNLERETEKKRQKERQKEREREKERGENRTFIYFEAFTVLMRPQHEMNRQKL